MEVRGQPQAPVTLNPVKNSCNHWKGGWVGPITGVHPAKEISCPCGK